MIYLKHNETKERKSVPSGVSFTVMFFGAFVPLLRGDFLAFIVILALDIFTAGIHRFVTMFLYNNYYINKMMKKGFEPV